MSMRVDALVEFVPPLNQEGSAIILSPRGRREALLIEDLAYVRPGLYALIESRQAKAGTLQRVPRLVNVPDLPVAESVRKYILSINEVQTLIPESDPVYQ